MGQLANSFLAVGEAGTLLQFDSDGDDVPDYEDNCPNICNITQLDADNDAIGDVCDSTPGLRWILLSHSVSSSASSRILTAMASPTLETTAPSVSNPTQTDTDHDSFGDVCDICPNDPTK